MAELDIVTCLQEKWDNATLTVRRDGHILGSIVQDSRNCWLARETPPPEPRPFPTLREAVQFLVEQWDAKSSNGTTAPRTATPQRSRSHHQQ